MSTSAQIRSQLIQALSLDLVGPTPDILAQLELEGRTEEAAEAHRVVPVRFVQTCPNGHLSDIDWRELVHRGKSSCRATLWLDEAGTGNDFTEVFVRCSNPKCMEEKAGRGKPR
jgi:hypothetical protein